MQKKEHISLEELLKLKRAEHPSKSDWQKFDAQLKRKMICTLVKKPSFFAEVARILSSKTAMSGGALALILAVFSPIYIDYDAASNVLESNGQKATTSSLPILATNFATNELPINKSESLVSAEMKSGGSEDVRYVFNKLGGLASNTVF